MAVSSKRDICNKIINVQKIGLFVFALLGLEAKYGPSAAVELDFRLNNSLQPIPKNLNLIGSELISVIDIEKGVNPSDEVMLEIKYASGDIKKIKTLCGIDTKNELEYYKNGGILQYVLRNMI